LSLDGGGVRGISSLEILRTIMAQVSSDPNAKPCNYFDMMAGTSTGGLIAVMLGRLQMTVQECMTAYYKLAESIFSGNSVQKAFATATTGACYSGDALEKAIKAVVKDKIGDENAVMLDGGVNGCKVFVAACRADDLNNEIATHLRTYVNREIPDSHADCQIWEACRATSAAPTYFPRMKIGDCEYVDGGLGFNNPVLLLLAEAASFFGKARPIGCLVTLGTGMAPNLDLGPEGTNPLSTAAADVKLVKALASLSTNSEAANGLAISFVPKDTYFRFNVGVKLYEKTGDNWADILIAMDDYKDMVKFVGLTDTYVKGQTALITQCALKVAKSA
jgi:predicted acylesterase/phospholipase RssA